MTEKTLGENIRETYMQNLILKDKVRELEAALEKERQEKHWYRRRWIKAVLWGCASVVRGECGEVEQEICTRLCDEYESMLM